MINFRPYLAPFVELGTVGVLAWVVVKGPPSTQILIASIMTAVITHRASNRTKSQTGIGSIAPGDNGGDPPESPPPVDKTGFTGSPPPDGPNPPSEAPPALRLIVGFTASLLLAFVGGSIILSSCAQQEPPTARDASFFVEMRNCKDAAPKGSEGWKSYLPCRENVLIKYGLSVTDGGTE